MLARLRLLAWLLPGLRLLLRLPLRLLLLGGRLLLLPPLLLLGLGLLCRDDRALWWQLGCQRGDLLGERGDELAKLRVL